MSWFKGLHGPIVNNFFFSYNKLNILLKLFYYSNDTTLQRFCEIFEGKYSKIGHYGVISGSPSGKTWLRVDSRTSYGNIRSKYRKYVFYLRP